MAALTQQATESLNPQLQQSTSRAENCFQVNKAFQAQDFIKTENYF